MSPLQQQNDQATLMRIMASEYVGTRLSVDCSQSGVISCVNGAPCRHQIDATGAHSQPLQLSAIDVWPIDWAILTLGPGGTSEQLGPSV